MEREGATIVVAGAPVLRAVAERVADERVGTRELHELCDSMVAAMRAAPGVGLAAPQIGVSLRVFVLEDTAREREDRERVPFAVRAIVNPEVAPVGDERVTFFEGCLSVPGYMALVERWREVVVTGVDPHGAPVRWQVSGWPARILQHELDHLDGTLYVDRMISRSLCTTAEVAERWFDAPVADVRSALRC